MTHWYRFEDVTYSAGVDEYGEALRGPGTVRIHLRTYEVIKETPKGVWLQQTFGGDFRGIGQRFVLRQANKRFACPTVDEALESFKARKRAQRRIYEARMRNAWEAIMVAENWEREDAHKN